MLDDFKKILELAVFAPSGDNMQPWKFVIENNSLFVYNLPEKDPTLYNYKQRAAYISHGALLENISLAASALGYQSLISYFPSSSEPNLTAKVSLTKNEKEASNLYHQIKKRHTNRKKYQNIPLKENERETLISSVTEPEIKIRLIENKDEIKKAAAAVCQVDRMIFENKTIHNFLFEHIRWSEDEELDKKNGLYLKTMELAPPQVAAFKLFKNWNVMKIFNAIGFPKLAVKSNFPLYTNVSGLGALLINNYENETFLKLGRAFQQFWLTATSLGLSIQPLTGVPLLMQRIADHNTNELEDYQVKIIKNSYKELLESCNEKEKTIGLFFRIGHAPEPSGLSSRLDPEIEIKN